MKSATTKIVEGGRIVLPADMRRALMLKQGDPVVIELTGEELRIRSTKAALRRVQAYLSDFRTEKLASDELIEDRRAEAAAERDR